MKNSFFKLKRMFTGIKDLDSFILEKFDDESLGRICSVNSYFRNLCKNDNFWKKRSEKRFNKYLYPLLETYKDAYSKTWKDYYVYLNKFIRKISSPFYKSVEDNIREFRRLKREDISLLLKIRDENIENFKEELLCNFGSFKWKNFLKDELMWLNLYSYYSDLNYYKEKEIYFEYLSTLNDKRINPNYILDDFLDIDLDEEESTRLTKLLLKNPRINVYDVMDAVDHDMTPNIHVLNVYLEYIRDQGETNTLLDKAIYFDTEGRCTTLNRINEYFAEEIQKNSVLPEILTTLKNYDEFQLRKILGYLRTNF